MTTEQVTVWSLSGMIDCTLLDPAATGMDIATLCHEAIRLGFVGVCVSGSRIEQVAKILSQTGILPVCVVGFPLGNSHPEAKVREAELAIEHGAREIDMVMNRGLIDDRDVRNQSKLYWDIERVVGFSSVPVKVILETAELTDDQITEACHLAQYAGAAFVKTSTGFCKSGGATIGHVSLMRSIVGSEMGVKASGGIRNIDQALAMVHAGANRLGIGLAAAVGIMEQARKSLDEV